MNSKISLDTKSKNLQLFLIQYISTFANWKKINLIKMQGQPMLVLSQNTKRESGRKAQSSNIQVCSIEFIDPAIPYRLLRLLPLSSELHLVQKPC